MAGHLSLEPTAALCCCTQIKEADSTLSDRLLTSSPLTESNRRPSPYHGESAGLSARNNAGQWAIYLGIQYLPVPEGVPVFAENGPTTWPH
jgi:hypothetical protein